MARKSRKETAAVAVQEADAACCAAIYVRLSVEDTHTHSVSIETQQMIIARYLEQYPEISVYDTYIDNGATGTNFHRPGFQQMLSDIEAGHVNCVIVKDLSRLGRNTKNEKCLCRSIGTGEAKAGRTGAAGQPQGSVQGDF